MIRTIAGKRYEGNQIAPGVFEIRQEIATRTSFSKYEFRHRLTFEEKRTMKESTDSGVQVIVDDFMSAEEIDFEDTDFQLALMYLGSIFPDTFTVARVDELTSPAAPRRLRLRR